MSDFTFDGFEPANTTPVPDVLFDVLLSELSESELKVLLYIIRRTAGFKKQTDAISLNQFQKGIKKRATGEILDRGCGVKDRATIIKALASLERKGCIQADKNDDPQGDKATSVYRIKFRSEVVGKTNHPTDIGSGQNQPPWFAKPTTGSGQNQLGVVGSANPQETVIQPNSKQETDKQESTSPQPESHDDESGSIEPTRTHALSDVSQDVKGHDDANTTQQTQQPIGQDSREKRATPTEQPAGSVAPSENNTHSHLSTYAPAYPQRGAKVAPRPSAFVAAPLFGTQKPARPQLTEMGKNVLEWYQIIQACKVRKTDANINACNGLGEEDGMSFDNLKKAIEHWEAHSYVKERQIPIDLQKLEDPKGAFTFAKAMLVIRPNKPKPPSERKPTLVSCANMSAEEYAAYLRR